MTTSQTQAFNYVPNQPVRIKNISSAYTVTGIDAGVIINCTSGTFTIALTAAATLGAGFNCWIWNLSGTETDVVTIDPNGSETIDGVSTLIIRRGEGTQIICNGTNWDTGNKKTMRGYAENLGSNISRPVATGLNSVAIGYGATASGSQSIAIGPNSTASSSSGDSLAVGQSANSSGRRASALGYATTASTTYATSIGANSSAQGSQAVTGSGAMALGGSYASGTDSFAAAVANNTSSYGARSTGALALGDRTNASGSKSIGIGQFSISSSNNTIAIGASCEATINNATAIGYYARAAEIGKYAYASNLFSTTGDCQTGLFVLCRQTTDATATVLTTNNSAAGTTNQVILPNNSAYAFTGTVVARQQASGGTASAAWKVEGLIRREGSAGTTTLVASTVTAISNVPGWTLALSADTTNGGLAVTATGAAATNIRWAATIQTSEVTYA